MRTYTAGRGAVSEHPHAARSRAVSRDRRRSRRDAGERGKAAEQPPLAAAQFERIRALSDEAARLAELQAIVDWTNPARAASTTISATRNSAASRARRAVRRGSGAVSIRRDRIRLSSGMAVVLGDARRIVLRRRADAEVSGARLLRPLQPARRLRRRSVQPGENSHRRERQDRDLAVHARSRIRWRRWSSTSRRPRRPAAR